jgi:dihydroxyacetone kinase-like protein
VRKWLNSPEDITTELLEGLAAAFPEYINLAGSSNKLVVNSRLGSANRVTIVSLGGTGHEPALTGIVGDGCLDVAVAGDIFAAPGPQDVLEALRLADRGHGTLLVVLNHSGDMLTGDAVMRAAVKEGLHVRRVNTQEDIANAPRSNADDRRGLVGIVPLLHIAGAAAAEGRPLDEVADIAQWFADNMATVAVAASGATHPATGQLISDFNDGEMEIGAGQHGEGGGGGRSAMLSADVTSELMLKMLIADLEIDSGEKVLLLVNGSGATTLMELSIVFRRAAAVLHEKNISVSASYCGELLTVQEQVGFQMCLARMNDVTVQLWNRPCVTPFFNRPDESHR